MRAFRGEGRPDTLTLAAMGLGLLIAYRASAQLPLTALGLAIFVPLALWRPDLALAYVPLSVALYFMPKGLFDARFGIRDTGIYLPLHEVVLVITAAGAALDWKRVLVQLPERPQGGALPGRSGRRWPPGHALLPQAAAEVPQRLANVREAVLGALPLALFALAGLWGFAIASAKGPALRELRWLIIEPLVFCGLLLRYARRGGDAYWRLIVGFWLAGGALGGLVGVLQLLGLNLAPLIGTKVGFSEDVIGVEGVRRATGLYGHPNNLGLAMGRAWPLAAALAHLAFWEGPGGPARIRRSWPALLVMLLCLGGLLASFSRGAYLGAAAAGLALGLLLVPPRLLPPRRVLLPMLALAGLAALGGLALLALNVERFNLLGASSGARVQTWASALAMLRDHPLGIGLDQFGALYPQYIDPALAGTNEINTAHPHDLLLDIALRMGPLGLAAFAWLLVVFYRRILARAGRPSPMRAVYVGALAAMAGALVHGLVELVLLLARPGLRLLALYGPGALAAPGVAARAGAQYSSPTFSRSRRFFIIPSKF